MPLNGNTNLKFLSSKEVTWLQKLHREIRVGITQIPNQVLVENGKYRGFSIDLFQLITQKWDLKFQYCYYPSWGKLMEAVKKREVDILFLAQKTPSRLQYLYFTDTVLSQQNKLVVNIAQQFRSLEELKNHKVAITAGSAIEEYIRYYYPGIKLVLTDNEKEALRYVAQKKVDATVLELVRASYYIRKFNLNNLVISTDIGYDYYLSIASIKELPELNIILSKTLKHIKKKELEALKLKWGYIKEEKFVLDKETLTYISIVFGIVLPFSIYLSIINNRLENEMQEKQKALDRVIKLRDSKLNDMGKIISMIAHQWRQPLHNLSLLIQLLRSKHQRESLDHNAIEYFFKNATLQIKLMSQTIDDFIHFFKVSETKERFNVKEVIENLLHITKPLFAKDQIEISFKSSNEEFFIESYQGILFQIIMNILHNAKDALLENRDDRKKIEITLTKNAHEIVIDIYDNAGGIPVKYIDRVFEPYFSTKNEKNGTGLGLYIAKVFMQERMQGSIDVSNGKEGARFSVKLQIA